MDKIVEEMSKIFSHLARDIQNYIFTGLIVLSNCYLLDRIYNSGSISCEIHNHEYYLLMLVIASYIIGQICLSFYTVILELPRIDEKLYQKMFTRRYPRIASATDEASIKQKGKIFKADKDLYFHFIERDVNLGTIRWNYSSAFFICSLINFGFCIFSTYYQIIFWTAVAEVVISIFLMILHIITQKENVDQLNKLQ